MKSKVSCILVLLLLASMFVASSSFQAAKAGASSQAELGQDPSIARINTAITGGLKYLSSIQNASGAWNDTSLSGHSYPVAQTAMAVLAFENNGHYGWNKSDSYHTTVQNGLNYLFSQGHNMTMYNKPASAGGYNCDVSGTGIGIWFSDHPTLVDIYETSMVLMAIIASNAPTNVTSPGPLGVRTYHAIAQDIVDYLALAQNTWSNTYLYSSYGLPEYEGGWGYCDYSNTSMFGPGTSGFQSDNSNTPWAVGALTAAELWGIKVPSFVATELKIWITTCQYITKTSYGNTYGWLNGSFMYLPMLPGTWYNYYYPTIGLPWRGIVADTAAGIEEMIYANDTNNANFTAAEGAINYWWTSNLYSTTGYTQFNVNIGNLYCMYCVMRTMREATPPIKFIPTYPPGWPCYAGGTSIEWYNGTTTAEYAAKLLSNQASNGSWFNWNPWPESDEYSLSLSTALGVLILQGGLTAPVVVRGLTLIVTVCASSRSAMMGIPLKNVTVSIVGPENLSGLTNGSGQITFKSILAGSYVVDTSPGPLVYVWWYYSSTTIFLNRGYNLLISPYYLSIWLYPPTGIGAISFLAPFNLTQLGFNVTQLRIPTTVTFVLNSTNVISNSTFLVLPENLGGNNVSLELIHADCQFSFNYSAYYEHIALFKIDHCVCLFSAFLIGGRSTGLNTAVVDPTSCGSLNITSGEMTINETGTITNDIYTPENPIHYWMMYTGFANFTSNTISLDGVGTVEFPMSVSISPADSTISLGKSVLFTSNLTGGTLPYTLTWHVGALTIVTTPAETGPWNYTFTPTTSGIYHAYANVTDAFNETALSATATVDVTSPPPVGGYAAPISTLVTNEPISLAAYIALASTILIATAATAIYVQRVKRRKEKQ